MATVVILKLFGAKWYVCSTERKLEDFLGDLGKNPDDPEWIRRHGYEQCVSAQYLEDITVVPLNTEYFFLQYVYLYGITNVRGGTITDVKLNDIQIGYLVHNAVKCDFCHMIGHRQNSCDFKKQVPQHLSRYCTRCKRRSHFADRCFAKTTFQGEPLVDQNNNKGFINVGDGSTPPLLFKETNKHNFS